jgi:glutamine---fructose-6-phosphate transaminase (isomerizing)
VSGIAPDGGAMRAEILEQPDVWASALGRDGGLDAAAERIRAAAPAALVLLARGTSGNAGLYGRYLAETVLGMPTSSLAPSTVTVYDAPPSLGSSAVIALSQSGASPDLVAALRAARATGALTIAVVNRVDSALAAAAELVVDVGAGPEHAVAATKSYTAQLLALARLVAVLSPASAPHPLPLAGLPELGRRALEVTASAGWTTALEILDGAERVAVLGRGYSLATARETALKLMETDYLWAQGFSSAEFVHGPVAALDDRVPVLLFGDRDDHPVELRRRIRAAGAPLIAIGDVGPGDGDAVLPLPPMDRRLRPLVEIVPAQLLALELAVRRGQDPDRPRGLMKETLTR